MIKYRVGMVTGFARNHTHFYQYAPNAAIGKEKNLKK